MRLACQQPWCEVPRPDVVATLFDEVLVATSSTPGHTRLLRLGYRRGDSAEVAVVELIGSEYDPNAVEKTDRGGPREREAKKKGLGTRMREALGCSCKKDDTGGGKQKAEKASTKCAGRKIATPRKAGGS